MSPAALTPRQRRAALALASGASGKDAAVVAGVTDRTLRRWQTFPTFEAAVDAAIEEIVAEHRGAVRSLILKARSHVTARLDDLTVGGADKDKIALAILRDVALAAFGIGNAGPGEGGMAVAQPVMFLVSEADLDDDPDVEPSAEETPKA